MLMGPPGAAPGAVRGAEAAAGGGGWSGGEGNSVRASGVRPGAAAWAAECLIVTGINHKLFHDSSSKRLRELGALLG